jgi:hypothetical protein
MRTFANLFLILFLTDAGISLLDELLNIFFGVGHLTGLRNLVAFGTIAVSVLLYILLGIDRRLPKRILLPLLLFVFWGALGMWPLWAVLDNAIFGPVCAGAQVLVGTAALLYVHAKNRKVGWGLPRKKMLVPPRFSLRNTLVFFAANIVLVLIILFFYGIFSANSYLVKSTAGFMRLGFDGVYMTEKIYRSDAQTIRLAGMIHIGRKQYYDAMAASIPRGRTIVLAEGVSDRNKLLQYGFDHGHLAKMLGLASQREMTFSGRLIEPDEMNAPGETAPYRILRADMDMSDLDPRTIEFLNMIALHLIKDSSLIESFNACNDWMKAHLTDNRLRIIMNDILYRRNATVIRYLQEALKSYDTIVIAWGALHMAEIEEAVIDHGFHLTGSTERLGVDFQKMDIARFLGQSVDNSDSCRPESPN